MKYIYQSKRISSAQRARHARWYLKRRYTSRKYNIIIGKCWAVESAFSLVIRIMGESVSATKIKHIFYKCGSKFKLTNILINGQNENINNIFIKTY
jgi:hypothetical protein